MRCVMLVEDKVGRQRLTPDLKFKIVQKHRNKLFKELPICRRNSHTGISSSKWQFLEKCNMSGNYFLHLKHKGNESNSVP